MRPKHAQALTPKFFDYESLAKEHNVSTRILQRLKREIRKEFPDNDMMYELHLLRAIRVLVDKPRSTYRHRK